MPKQESEYHYIRVVIPFLNPKGEVWRYPFQDIGPGWDDLEACKANFRELIKQHPTLEFDIVDDRGEVVVEK